MTRTIDGHYGKPIVADAPSDPINPSHYKGDAVAVFCEQFELTAWEAQVIKYTARNKQKNGIEDLKKALWYLEREIKIRSAKQGIPGGP